MFGVSAGEALSYATIVHAVNILPVTLIGLIMASIEGVSLLWTPTERLNAGVLKKNRVCGAQLNSEKQI